MPEQIYHYLPEPTASTKGHASHLLQPGKKPKKLGHASQTIQVKQEKPKKTAAVAKKEAADPNSQNQSENILSKLQNLLVNKQEEQRDPSNKSRDKLKSSKGVNS